jgi:hypothetical protein
MRSRIEINIAKHAARHLDYILLACTTRYCRCRHGNGASHATTASSNAQLAAYLPAYLPQ